MSAQAKIAEILPLPPKKRVQGGVATTDLIMSASVGGNADVFPQILALHIPKGARIADVTYGNGVFWRGVETSEYELVTSDIANGVDCRALPYEAASFDAVVLPALHGRLAA